VSLFRSRVAALLLGVALSAVVLPEPEAQAQAQGVVYGPGVSPRRSSGLGLGGAGLILLLGGLATSAGGFGILYACREGESCHNDTTTALGWVLAAPGIPPIGLGLLFLWLDKGGSLSRTVYNEPRLPVTFTAAPIPSGGMLGVTYQF
jgi:hypothetical protein